MENRNTFLLCDTEAFMRGDLDNVTVAGSHILLDMVAGGYVPYGCYTSPAVPMPLFDAVRLSWNASAPAGTAVEAQARVLVDGNWSSWCSFGKWGPFLHRAGATPKTRGPLVLSPDMLTLDSKCSTQVQMRIYLYTNSDKQTPCVRLLGATVRPVDVIPANGQPVLRRLHLPPYSVFCHAPALRAQMDLAAALAGLTNRWGADLLPEELALSMADWGNGGANLSLAAAAVGGWGFPAWVQWTDLAGLRADVRAGYGAVVSLNSTPAQQAAGMPPVRHAALCGFSVEHGVRMVILCDPWAEGETDFCAETVLPLDDFLVAWDNLALTVRKRVPSQLAEAGRPLRTAVSLHPVPAAEADGEAGLCRLLQGGHEILLPDSFCEEDGRACGVLAWTVADGIAHATTAHKPFHFVQPEQGGIRLPTTPQSPQKYTVYAIDSAGSLRVGDITR